MFSNHVTLRSGGYLVINPTEALVSIDVNSGRSTREHNIEDTALKTNLEAAEEVARQLRLRDLAGLIVIDFIDMDEKRNNRAVEKKLNECLKNDRARIQVGRISPFGLLEMSRQRIRTGVLESSSVPCPHCAGTGTVRATPSVALHVLRAVEETLIKSASHNLVVRTRIEVAFYILNQKRVHLRELETRFGVTISVVVDPVLTGMTTYAIDRGEPALRIETKAPATGVQIDAIAPLDEPEDAEIEFEADEADEADETEEAAEATGSRSEEARGEDDDGTGRRRRRRRRRRGRNGDRESLATGTHTEGAPESDEDDDEDEDESTRPTDSEDAPNGEAVEAPARQSAARRDAATKAARTTTATVAVAVGAVAADAAAAGRKASSGATAVTRQRRVARAVRGSQRCCGRGVSRTDHRVALERPRRSHAPGTASRTGGRAHPRPEPGSESRTKPQRKTWLPKRWLRPCPSPNRSPWCSRLPTRTAPSEPAGGPEPNRF